MSGFYDTHAHFPADPVMVASWLERAASAGVTRMLAVGGNPELDAGARLAFRAAPGRVRLALGLDRAQALRPDACAAAAALLTGPDQADLSAVGELGLDYHYHRETDERRAQCALMECQLALAARIGRPVIIHPLEADDDTLALLRGARVLPWFRGDRPGVIHCFTGGQAFADALLELGYFLSFSGIVTFASAAPLRAVARAVPGERLLIETDSPYLTPVPLRGRPNEPSHVPHVAACLARARGSGLDELAAISRTNAERLFLSHRASLPESR
jgi:TatD DNase family protein